MVWLGWVEVEVVVVVARQGGRVREGEKGGRERGRDRERRERKIK